jgi:hypothetical protein
MKPSVVLAFAAILLTGHPLPAEPLWLLNFNGLSAGPAPQRLTPRDTKEVSVTEFLEQPEGAEAGRTVIVKSDGPDGGMALELRPGAVQNGAGYVTPPRSGSLDSNALTFEALVKPARLTDFARSSFQILNNQPGGSIPQSILSTDGDGTVSFSDASRARVQGSLKPDRWSHVAAVYMLADMEGGECRLKLYVNGKLAGEDTFSRPAGKVPRALGIGRYLQWGKSDSFQGQIDAIAVSDEALEPGKFVLPSPR